MNSKTLRRLAADHSKLHRDLPPNYFFPPSTTTLSDEDGDLDDDDDAGIPDDLTSLDIFLAGPHGTPFSTGVFKLHLEMPANYPAAPPTAHFRTQIFHPNVEPSNGAVCVDTLKRDWKSTLTLRDVLVTITCLLVQPNPDSALNAEAGKLVTEDWEAFQRRAKLMTSIHAGVTRNLVTKAEEARRRGDDPTSHEQIKDKSDDKSKKAVITGPHQTASSSSGMTGLRAKLEAVRRVDSEEENAPGSAADAEPSTPVDDSEWIPAPTASHGISSIPLGAGSDNAFGIRTAADETPSTILPTQSLPPLNIDFATPMEVDSLSSAQPNMDAFSTNRVRATPTSPPSTRVTRQRKYNTFPPPRTPTRGTRANGRSPIGRTFQRSPPAHVFNSNALSHKPVALVDAGRTNSAPLNSKGSDAEGQDLAYLFWAARQEVEMAKMSASHGTMEETTWKKIMGSLPGKDVRRWNRGHFGPRTGLKRL